MLGGERWKEEGFNHGTHRQKLAADVVAKSGMDALARSRMRAFEASRRLDSAPIAGLYSIKRRLVSWAKAHELT
jgi:hypothetical protein